MTEKRSTKSEDETIYNAGSFKRALASELVAGGVCGVRIWQSATLVLEAFLKSRPPQLGVAVWSKGRRAGRRVAGWGVGEWGWTEWVGF